MSFNNFLKNNAVAFDDMTEAERHRCYNHWLDLHTAPLAPVSIWTSPVSVIGDESSDIHWSTTSSDEDPGLARSDKPAVFTIDLTMPSSEEQEWEDLRDWTIQDQAAYLESNYTMPNPIPGEREEDYVDRMFRILRWKQELEQASSYELDDPMSYDTSSDE